ncbi:MAG: dihydroorotase [Eubacteriales bacterium]|nr:dihydroorotase [Eubacteriales bacterium]
MKTLLEGGQIVTAEGIRESGILFEDGIIIAVGKHPASHQVDQVIHCDNFFVAPGLKDVHVHLREPGFAYKETIRTGTMAAARGGYTTVCSMPNLDPVPSCRDALEKQLAIIRRDAVIRVIPYGAITKDGKGRAPLADMEGLSPDVAAFSDDGRGVQSEALMRAAMEKARALGKIIVAHCEDERYPTQDPQSEYLQVRRDLALAKETGCRYHVCHVSTAASVEAVRAAKREGVDVTCETAPHYLLLCDEDTADEGRFKMNPPLRTARDKEALLAGLLDGTIDMIATDHAPHSLPEKAGGFRDSLFGIVGLETAFPMLHTHLVRGGVLTLSQLIEKMSLAPARRFDLPGKDLAAGEPADLILIDPAAKGVIRPEEFESMGRSTPFAGETYTGRSVMTICAGRVVHQG